MGVIISLIINTIAVFATAYILPGVTVDGVFAAFMTAIFLGVINTFLKPILQIIALPITILTLGLFALVINALLILLATTIVPGFHVDGFWTAFFFSIVLSMVNFFLGSLT